MKKSNGLAFLLLVLVAQLFLVSPALAASKAEPRVSLDISEGRLLTLPGPAASVFLADPSIADVQVPQPNRIFIFGKKTGQTTLYALADDGKQLAVYTVDVHLALGSAREAVAANPAGADVHISSTDTGVNLTGAAPDPNTAAAITNTTQGYLQNKEPIDATQLKINSSAQVMLRVWIGEVDRTVTKNLAFNWDAGGIPGLGTLSIFTGRQVFSAGCSLFDPSAAGCVRSGGTGSSSNYGSILAGLSNGKSGGYAVIDALASEGLVTTLAEPTLTALSGESASFLVGGQFPIPIAQGGNNAAISIEFQTYGVSLAFVPTVLAPNRISLKVAPEVSELSTQGQIDLNGFAIPGLTVRRAQTTVELGSGQSFAIAGLLQSTSSNTLQKYPGLGDLPIIGTLFRSTNFQHGETELVIIITPYLVRPVDDPNRLKLPTDGITPPTDIERIFRQRMADPVATPVAPGTTPSSVSVLTGPKLAGDAGFDLE